MSKNSYLVTVIIVLLALGGFILYKKQTSQPKVKEIEQKMTVREEPKKSESTESSKTTKEVDGNQITYTDNGFSPASINIKLGEAVSWKNDSSDLMWVASVIHPTHLEYPGFDQLKGSEKGTTYSFKFEKVGTWKFHNHLNPGITGKVVVE